jgi:hypothetical protein
MVTSYSKRSLLFAMCSALLLIATGAQGAPDKLTMDVVISQGRVKDGVKVLKLKRGEKVVLTVISDVPDELHVHGFEKHLKLVPDKAASIEIIANRTGRFTIELHRVATTVGVLEVYPND